MKKIFFLLVLLSTISCKRDNVAEKERIYNHLSKNIDFLNKEIKHQFDIIHIRAVEQPDLFAKTYNIVKYTNMSIGAFETDIKKINDSEVLIHKWNTFNENLDEYISSKTIKIIIDSTNDIECEKLILLTELKKVILRIYSDSGSRALQMKLGRC